MKLKKLIADLPIEIYKSGKDVEIANISSHSKSVAPGSLFIAKKGTVDDGAKYIDEAISNGAVAILSEFADPFLKETIQLISPQVENLEGVLAARFFGEPARSLLKIGVTGTNGKTTSTYLIKHLLDQLNLRCGLIGTIEYIVGDHCIESDRTTPDVITNHKLLKEMVKQHCKAVVMEVSSHALAQRRVDCLDFDIAIFTNLTQDHLDYHKTMEEYALQKSKLFSSLKKESTALVFHEDPWRHTITKNCCCKQVTYGFEKEADLYAHTLNFDASTTRWSVTYCGETQNFEWPLIGRFNVLNALAAMGVALTIGIPFNALPPLFAHAPSVLGRLQRVENNKNLAIYVDYAHTPDALEKVLKALREVVKGKILTVFGCGGDRDRNKRAKMGKVADLFSDFTFITSDNPRTEDPKCICNEILEGFSSNRFLVEMDRKCAIEKAILQAHSEDLILIAGKGHETYQIFAHQTHPFDDCKIAQELANR